MLKEIVMIKIAVVMITTAYMIEINLASPNETFWFGK